MTAFLEPFSDYLEWVAALLGLITVALVVRRSIYNYPFALAMVSLYFFEFLDEKLYSDALLQIFIFVINLVGWILWNRAPKVDRGIQVERMDDGQRLRWVATTAVLTLGWGWAMATYTDAAAPYWDAAVVGTSVAAQWLQSLRRLESWVLWIVADCLAVPLYLWKGLHPTAILYTVFLALAVLGLLEWARTLRAEQTA